LSVEIEELVDIDIEEPPQFKVILLNDDYSTMDFVIEILQNIFKKSMEDATTLMLEVHNKGKAICGIYSYEIAVTKVAQVAKVAKENGFPLKAIVEED
jgi:ATP-dependent Clp protease adaptor protein ClpS